MQEHKPELKLRIPNHRSKILITFFSAVLIFCWPARAGFNNSEDGMGAGLTAAESNAVAAAIGQIQILAAGESGNNSTTLQRIADCLLASLKKGKICRETNPKADWKGITATDG